MAEASFFEKVYDLVRLIPHGRVTSYGAIAEYLGSKGSVVEDNTERGVYPNSIIIFGLDGSYQKTIDTGFVEWGDGDRSKPLENFVDDKRAEPEAHEEQSAA